MVGSSVLQASPAEWMCLRADVSWMMYVQMRLSERSALPPWEEEACTMGKAIVTIMLV